MAREAGYDLDRIFDELRAAEARHPGPLIRSAKELQHYAAEQDRRLDAESTFARRTKTGPED